jgi:hypothetical protein
VAPIRLLKNDRRTCEVRIRFRGRRFLMTLAAGNGYLSDWSIIRGRG